MVANDLADYLSEYQTVCCGASEEELHKVNLHVTNSDIAVFARPGRHQCDNMQI